MKELDKMLGEGLYAAWDDELLAARKKARELMYKYNNTDEDQMEERQNIMGELLGRTGENFKIEPPFRCDYGSNIVIGENFYANFDCVILDVAEVEIGNNVMFGPRVGIYTPGHPIDADTRVRGLEFGKKIKIGNNVWFGGDVVVNPGVTIGNNVIIGSGSIVTKDIPDNVIAAGNPCKVIRAITDEDKTYWEKLEAQYHEGVFEKIK